eukprot:TCALIF_07466-PA protein Name:"Protein of unknown function" AED:0.85 eAED:0.85 QI:0/-1/0/1/-1/1/1/0/139
MEKLAGYNFTVLWAFGKTHIIADALSRSPVIDSIFDGIDDCHDICAMLVNTSTGDPNADLMLETLIEAANSDKSCPLLARSVNTMSHEQVKLLPESHPARAFFKCWTILSHSLDENSLVLFDGSFPVVYDRSRARAREL